jgi:hypothetical protein
MKLFIIVDKYFVLININLIKIQKIII